MKVFCTYCSARKNPNSGLIPATQRYRSPRIDLVQELAKENDICFCILSGKFGLVNQDMPLPLYDHLLKCDEVPSLVQIVVNQIRQMEITEMDYYTRLPSDDPNIDSYKNVIEKACCITNVNLKIIFLEKY